MITLDRIKTLNNKTIKSGTVIYWMSRDQRVNDNWALVFAQQKAAELKQTLEVIFTLSDNYLGATIRQYDFMLKGLEQVEESLKQKNICFNILIGNPAAQVIKYVKKVKAGLLVTDFDPLKIKRSWKKEVVDNILIPFLEVDAHNIVPYSTASIKHEYGAYTIRPKIQKVLTDYLVSIPIVNKQQTLISNESINWDKLRNSLKVNTSVAKVDWISPGEKNSLKCLDHFIKDKLNKYSDYSNDPNKDIESNLSVYLHFGQISSQKVAIKILSAEANEISKQDFLEQLIIRKELSDNFCFYNNDYDNFLGIPDWAQKTLKIHSLDKRKYLYNLREFELSKTHDLLWNAAQNQMISKGKMHGYLRMYWAKKILEWSNSPQEAIETAIYLNDKYELDGRDPNGYVGILWSIGGLHDRAWREREIFGKVRYMSYDGCKSKFNVKEFINKYT